MSCIPDVARTMEMYALYQAGKTCHAVALAFKTTRQSVWERFRRQRLPMRASSRSKALPFIEFEGARYAPEKDGYFRKTTGGGTRPLLHHAIYEKNHGRIARGHIVQFVDGDRMNLEPDNLVSLPRSEQVRAKPIKMKSCLACGRLMGKRVTGNFPESPSAYARRRTCNAQCSAAWKRGRRRGAKMP